LQEQHLRQDVDANIAAFAMAISIDKSKLADGVKVYFVDSKIRVANQQARGYQIEGVPSSVVSAKYVTSPDREKVIFRR
jgi:hypothetical protein